MAKGSGRAKPKIVSRAQWLAARKRLLTKEKTLTRARDALNAARRALPWVKVEKAYVFDGPAGRETLPQLFAGRSQLAVYHFMFSPEWGEGCKHCSFWTDHYDGMLPHLAQRDVTLVAVSRAPLTKLEAFKRRMGWQIKWLSSGDGDFNYDYGVSFEPEDYDAKGYNFGALAPGGSDREGLSVFARDAKGAIYHTYSTYARGIDLLNGTYNLLDLVPKGRDEDPDDPQSWVRHHDRYDSLVKLARAAR